MRNAAIPLRGPARVGGPRFRTRRPSIRRSSSAATTSPATISRMRRRPLRGGRVGRRTANGSRYPCTARSGRLMAEGRSRELTTREAAFLADLVARWEMDRLHGRRRVALDSARSGERRDRGDTRTHRRTIRCMSILYFLPTAQRLAYVPPRPPAISSLHARDPQRRLVRPGDPALAREQLRARAAVFQRAGSAHRARLAPRRPRTPGGLQSRRCAWLGQSLAHTRGWRRRHDARPADPH